MQQSLACEQICPKNAHVPASPFVPLSPAVPPSGEAPPPHVPLELPGGITQTIPAQQSAVVVQPPVLGTQLVPQTKGEPPGTLFGTHASPQQSALDAHGWPWSEPASGQMPVIVQRGMPR